MRRYRVLVLHEGKLTGPNGIAISGTLAPIEFSGTVRAEPVSPEFFLTGTWLIGTVPPQFTKLWQN
jgi:hypothetical protein